MESWNSVINAALLGTEKKTLRKEDVEAALADSVDAITQKATGGEETFLQTAALVYNYRQCGFAPVKKEGLSLPVAEAEEKGHASASAHALLREIMDAGSSSLLQLWLEQCAASDKLVQPDFLPLLLTTAVKQKGLQTLVKTVGGKRGKWLTQFNEEWTWAEVANDEELWQTGSLTQRKAVLAQMRKTSAAAAREALRQTWPQENAAAKEALLEEMLVNAGDEDVAWLESLLNEKSAKVKEAALQVLKTIPSSTIVQSYWTLLKQSIRLTTSKGILGIGSKTSLDIKLATVDASLFKTGISQLPSQANISDEEFIIYQLMGSVPPHFWEAHFNMSNKEIIEMFLKNEKHRSCVGALGLAASRFKNLNWLRTVIDLDDKRIYLDAFGLLPQWEAENYALKFLSLDKDAGSILHIIYRFSDEWSLPFAKAVLRFTAKSPYQYNTAFYKNLVHILPVPIVAELEKFTPKEEHLRHMWSNLSEHIAKLLTLKLQTLKAFTE